MSKGISLEAEMARLRDGSDRDELDTAIERLILLGNLALAPLTEAALDPRQPSGFRARALETAAEIGGRNVAHLLSRSATDPDFQVRWSAVVKLGRLGIREALPILERLLESDSAEWEAQPGFVLSIRNAAAEAIAAIRDASA